MSILGEASAETPLSGLIMLAQSHLFLDELGQSRSIYELALEKSTSMGTATDRLHMAAALAYWRPLLYNNNYPEKELVCGRAKTHYDKVEPWSGSDSYVNNVKIVYANQYHCDDPDWKNAPELLGAADAEASAIAHFIQAKRCTPNAVVAGCDYLSELTSAERHVLFARALLVRHYYLRETANNCASAQLFLNSFRNEAINLQDVRELRVLLKIKAMNCS